MKEKLSALMDGELSELEARHALEEIARDPAHRSTWERYHLVRHALRGELDLAAERGLPERVHERLAGPQPTERDTRWSPRTTRRFALLAMAAGVAAISIVGVRLFDQPAPVSTPPLATTAPVAQPVVQTARAGAKRWTETQPDVGRTLDSYLVQHNEFASAGGMGGMLPYVRVVGYNNQPEQ
jgi:sigma-E factor negative regulatory protein RseA